MPGKVRAPGHPLGNGAGDGDRGTRDRTRVNEGGQQRFGARELGGANGGLAEGLGVAISAPLAHSASRVFDPPISAASTGASGGVVGIDMLADSTMPLENGLARGIAAPRRPGSSCKSLCAARYREVARPLIARRLSRIIATMNDRRTFFGLALGLLLIAIAVARLAGHSPVDDSTPVRCAQCSLKNRCRPATLRRRSPDDPRARRSPLPGFRRTCWSGCAP